MVINRCAACGQRDPASLLCHFCARTRDLILADRCVSCCEPVDRDFDARVEGRCAECRSRNVIVSHGTRWLLNQAAAARYYARPALRKYAEIAA